MDIYVVIDWDKEVVVGASARLQGAEVIKRGYTVIEDPNVTIANTELQDTED